MQRQHKSQTLRNSATLAIKDREREREAKPCKEQQQIGQKEQTQSASKQMENYLRSKCAKT